MAKGSNTVEKVRQLAEPIAAQLGLGIWDVRFVKEGAQQILRVYIDKDGPVGIDDCVEMTRALDKPLDEIDPIEKAYCLEVSSPGIERELTRKEHFEKSLGKKIKVKTIRPVNEKREFSGVLEDFDGQNITLRDEDGSGIVLTKKEASWVKLDDFDL